jgi:4-diphosphocytidyl-2-C-methyl-D-erythritol kinase
MTIIRHENRFINKTVTFPSPAKINLFLHITGQRADGYHELETLFQFLDYGDSITFSVTKDLAIDLVTPIKGVAHNDNLIVKAAKLLQHKSKKSLGVKIDITKVLPMGGGLGGGSSNAATVLIALNHLWQCQLSNDQLARLGLSLGADVPIFIHGFSAFAQGIGEKLTAIQPPESWYLISKPQCSIPTAKIFSAKDLPRNSPALSKSSLHKANFMSSSFYNDCQTVVIKQYPEVANLLAWLLEYAPSRMTGTGACIFSTFASQKEALAIQAKLPKGIDSFVARGSNTSPLANRVAKLPMHK